MSAQTETVERTNQATPLANDVLGILRGQLTSGGPGPGAQGERGQPQGIAGKASQAISEVFGGQSPQQRQGAMDAAAFGTGVGPLQRQAGTAIQQLVGSLQGQQGGDLSLPTEQRQAIEQTQAQAREKALADLGEQFGVAGSSLGTPQSVGQARLLSELIPRQTQQIFEQQIARGQENRAQTGQLLQSIMGMQQLGQQNIEPFLRIASQGILAPEVVQRESPWVTGLSALAGGAMGAGSLMKGLNA